MKHFILYEGKEFVVEWYFDDRGNSIAFEYFKDLSLDRQKKLLNLVKLLAENGKIFNEEKFRHEGDQIYAFKPSPDRFLCFFFEGSKVIITNAFEKKTDKLTPRDKQKALKLKADYIKRCREKTYYEEEN